MANDTMRWAMVGLVGYLMLSFWGCASTGADVVADPDAQFLEEMTQFEVEKSDLVFQAAGAEVHATLTRPQGERDVPGIVLVAGSGPTDRDWNNPLLPGDNGTAIELSQRLARAGIAVLRYDKRGTGHTQLPGAIDWDDYLTEVEAAVARLREIEAVDPQRIMIAGHSEGGAHALRVVAEDRAQVQGLILLATAGRSMRSLIISQVTDQLNDAGLEEPAIERELTSLRRAMDTVAGRGRVNAAEVSEIPGLVALVETLQTDDARDFAAALLPWEPAQAIVDVEIPILILSGLKDTQIDAQHDSAHLAEVAQRHNEQVQLVLVEDADHVLKFQPRPRDEMGPQHSLVYNDPTRNLDEAVLMAIVAWVYEQ